MFFVMTFPTCPTCGKRFARWKDLVTGFFLLKKPATSPRAVALRLSSPLLKKEVITSLLFCTRAKLLVTNNSSPSLGIFATPARCFLWSENIAPPHKSEKEQRSLLFLGSRFCAPARNRTSNNGLEVRSYIHLTTGAWCALRDLNP